MKKKLCLTAASLLTGCVASIGEDAFNQEADSMQATFPMHYEKLYECFIGNVSLYSAPFDVPYRYFTYPERRFAEVVRKAPNMGGGTAWFYRAKFVSKGQNSTLVTVQTTGLYGASDSWAAVEQCAKELSIDGTAKK